jgi:hypothetical protein
MKISVIEIFTIFNDLCYTGKSFVGNKSLLFTTVHILVHI